MLSLQFAQITFHFMIYLSFPIEIPRAKCERQHQDQVASKISRVEYAFLGQPKRLQQLGPQHIHSGASDPVSLSISSLLQSVCWIMIHYLSSKY